MQITRSSELETVFTPDHGIERLKAQCYTAFSRTSSYEGACVISSPKIALHIQNVFVEGRGQLLLVKLLPAMLLLHISHLYYYYLFYLFIYFARTRIRWLKMSGTRNFWRTVTSRPLCLDMGSQRGPLLVRVQLYLAVYWELTFSINVIFVL